MSPLANSATELFNEKIPAVLEKHRGNLPRVGMVFCFKITGAGGGEWTLDLFSPEPRCVPGNHGARCTIEVGYDDFKSILTQSNSALQLYFRGKLKIVGDSQMVMKLQPFFQLIA